MVVGGAACVAGRGRGSCAFRALRMHATRPAPGKLTLGVACGRSCHWRRARGLCPPGPRKVCACMQWRAKRCWACLGQRAAGGCGPARPEKRGALLAARAPPGCGGGGQRVKTKGRHDGWLKSPSPLPVRRPAAEWRPSPLQAPPYGRRPPPERRSRRRVPRVPTRVTGQVRGSRRVNERSRRAAANKKRDGSGAPSTPPTGPREPCSAAVHPCRAQQICWSG